MTETEMRPEAPKTEKPRARALPVLIILAALAVFAVFGLFVRAVLSGEWPEAKSKTVVSPEIVVLDDTWASEIAHETSRQAVSNDIDKTLEQVKALGANAVALTGCAPNGAALFRDSTETLTAAPCLAAASGFLSPFDAVQALVRAAARQEIQVYLLASDGRTVLGADALDTLPEWAQKLAARHGLTVLAPQESVGLVTLYTQSGGETVFLRADGNPALLAGTVQNAAENTAAGVILGGYSTLIKDDTNLMLYHTYLSGGTLPDLTECRGGKTIARTLAVTYPTQDGANIYTGTVFLMGTSDPSQPLAMNGTEVARYGTQGVWGILVTLNPNSANGFDFTNGSETLHYTVNAAVAAGGGSSAPAADGTPGDEAVGKTVRITDAIASALQNPASSSTIDETLYRGAAAKITAVRTYTSGAKITHAYRLSTGDYVRAATAEVIDTADAAFTSLGYAADAGANCAAFTLAGATPVVYHNRADNTLVLTFLDVGADAALLSDSLGDGTWCTASGAVSGGNYVLTLTFAEDDPLYGWAVNYDTAANTTTVWLKHTPHLSDAATGPLTGLTVMLDAGHGGDEKGAMGSGGMEAPVEKELNLSAATAAKYRLEQLGATVIMTRTDDTTLSLGARVTAMNEQHPDLFISVHHNSVELTSDVNQSTGTEAYWFYAEGETLADRLIENVCTATGRQNRGSAYGYYYVTRSNICPATLLELGFVTNPAEYEACADTATVWAEGGAIAEGVYQTVAANG